MDRDIRGAGGGQKEPRRPVEASDTLQSLATARVLMLVGLGEMGGLVEGDQSVFFGGVPLQDRNGAPNFERVRVEHRVGTAAQAPMAGFDEIETEYAVGVEVKAGDGIVRSIDNLDATAVRVTVSVRGLLAVNDDGDTNPTAVTMAVDLREPGGVWQQARQIDIAGKTRSKYQRSVRVDLPPGGPWQVRVRRVTPDSTTQKLINATEWDSYTMLQSMRLSYPGYALLGVEFDARQFSSLPEITSEWRLSVLQVPSNYDPASGTYEGAWNGTFKPAHSSNPAWCLYTFATDARFNLNLPPDGAWKWDLYRIGQWCDQLVSDGMGGLRRRFEMHGYHGDGADAWKVLQDMASVFCGKVVPSAGGIRVVADIPGDPAAKHFTPANVIDGQFSYASTEQADRYTVASVSLVDPEDGWKRGIEYVEHAEGLARYGYQPAEVVAVACTSRAQAQQLGRYILETAQTETELVTFAAGLYGVDLQPGELFTVFDPVVAGRRVGGRLLEVKGKAVTLDAPVMLDEGVSYSLECPMPDGSLVQRGVVVTPGEAAILRLVAPFPAQPVDGATWALIGTNLQPTLWRCVAKREREPGIYEVSGLQHNPNKWAAVEQGIRIDAPPASSLPDPAQMPAVSAVSMREVSYLTGDGRRAVRLEVDWPGVNHPYLRGYVVGYRQDGGNWLELPEQAANHAELEGLQPGQWQVRVSSVSAIGLRSIPALASIDARGHVAPPPAPALSATGAPMAINLAWTYPPGVPELVRAELFYSSDPHDGNPAKLADLAYPANSFIHQGVGLGVHYYYWLRVTDSWGNVSAPATADAATIRNPELLLQQLQNSIGGGQLAEELRQPLERLPDIAAQADEAGKLAVSAVETALQNVLASDQLGDVQTRQFAIARRDLKTTNEALKSEATAREVLAAKLGDTQAALIEERTARAEADRALASEVKTLSSQTAGDLATVRQELQTATGENGALSKRLDQLTAKHETTQAGLLQEQTARAEADKALASDVKSLTSKTDTGLAAVREELQAATGASGSLAQRLETLSTRIGDSEATIQQQSKSVDGLRAQWSLRITRTANGKTFASGMGLSNGEQGSELAVLADKFSVAQPDGENARQVFTVGSINGRPAVGVSGDLLLDGTLSANKIAAGEIRAEVGLYAAAIRGGYINMGGGQFVVDNNGNVSISSGRNGARTEITNRAIRVFDENGVLRVQIGDLAA
ncbi:phage tail protein [Chromobacterium subtsugae]|uniref:TipJ family phage tail tip protein n=1 Tax=Chromobacterium subtsugae TaxID=251747 RepID=UPI00064109C1|nr:phage tail protein [Chromobacterium subtsugae]